MDVLWVLVKFMVFTLPVLSLARKHSEDCGSSLEYPLYAAPHYYNGLSLTKDINTQPDYIEGVWPSYVEGVNIQPYSIRGLDSFPYYRGDNLVVSSGVDIGGGNWDTFNMQNAPITSEANVKTEKGNLKRTKIGSKALIGSTSGTSFDMINSPATSIIDVDATTKTSKRVKRNNEILRAIMKAQRQAEIYQPNYMDNAYLYNSWPLYDTYPYYISGYPYYNKGRGRADDAIIVTTKIDLGSGDFDQFNLKNSPITSDVNLKGSADDLRGTNVNSDIGLGRGSGTSFGLTDSPINSKVNIDTTQDKNNQNMKKKKKKKKRHNNNNTSQQTPRGAEFDQLFMYNADSIYNGGQGNWYNSWPWYNSYPAYFNNDNIEVSTDVDVGGGDWGTFNIQNSPATAEVHLEGDLDDLIGTKAGSTISIAKGSGKRFDMINSPVSSKVNIGGGKKKSKRNEILKALKKSSLRKADVKLMYNAETCSPTYNTKQTDFYNSWPPYRDAQTHSGQVGLRGVSVPFFPGEQQFGSVNVPILPGRVDFEEGNVPTPLGEIEFRRVNVPTFTDGAEFGGANVPSLPEEVEFGRLNVPTFPEGVEFGGLNVVPTLTEGDEEFGGAGMIPHTQIASYNSEDNPISEIFKKIDEKCPSKKTTREITKCIKKVFKHVHGTCKALLKY